MHSMIELRNITKVYERGAEKLHILNDLSLSVAKGDFVAIIGPSGSGKSTLMNTIGLLDIPTSGSYLLDGVATEKMSDNQLAELRNKKSALFFNNSTCCPG